MRRVLRVAFFLSFALVPACLAQLPSYFHVIPTAGKAKGNAGTDWVTDLSIANIVSKTATVGVHYFPSGQANTFNGTFAKTLTVGAGKSVFVKDVVASWFPQFGASTTGFLVIGDITTPVDCESESLGVMLVVSSRTYNNADPNKTFGQSVPSALLHINFTRIPSIITGVRHISGVPGYRSNAGVANLSTITIAVRVTVSDDNGNTVGSGVKSVPPLSLGQWSLSDFGVTTLNSGRVTFMLEQGSVVVDPCDQPDQPPACIDRCQNGCNGKYSFSNSGSFIGYVSKVDNGSGDAEFLLPAVDWFAYNTECEASGSSALGQLLQSHGFGPPPAPKMKVRKR